MTNTLIIKPRELAVELGMSTTSIWRWQQKNLLPKPIYIGNKMLGWKRTTILAWLDSSEHAGEI
jgi:predicted DNA-binding transcriptional regulator AlpA